jgi:hypothetical protein
MPAPSLPPVREGSLDHRITPRLNPSRVTGPRSGRRDHQRGDRHGTLRRQVAGRDQVLFDEIERSLTIEEGPGLPEWRGRSWLPEGGRVEPGRTYGLIRDDGRAGERIVESFGPDGTGGDVAVFQGNSRLE